MRDIKSDMVDTFLIFFVAMAKRELFIWKKKHEAMLLREVLVEEPHKYRPGSKERGISWRKIAEHLQESGMKLLKDQRQERGLISYTKTSRKEKRKRVVLMAWMLNTTRYIRP